jgi:hypothetical protein
MYNFVILRVNKEFLSICKADTEKKGLIKFMGSKKTRKIFSNINFWGWRRLVYLG